MQATVKVNDTYFSTKAYNTPAWKNMVMCQEVGHVLGLDHQDEDFSNANLGTCMDYTSDPSSNQHPDQHDYDMLEEIYAHLDSVNTTFPAPISGGKGGGKPSSIGLQMDVSDVSAWGDVVKTDARSNSRLYKRALDENITLYTFVIWAK
jgi:hypothetical protein